MCVATLTRKLATLTAAGGNARESLARVSGTSSLHIISTSDLCDYLTGEVPQQDGAVTRLAGGVRLNWRLQSGTWGSM